MVSRSLAVKPFYSLWVVDVFLFASVLALSAAMWVRSCNRAATIAPSLALCMVFVDACASRIYCGDFIELRVVEFSSNRQKSIVFDNNTTPNYESPLFSIRGLEFQQALLLHMMKGDLAVCIDGVAYVLSFLATR